MAVGIPVGPLIPFIGVLLSGWYPVDTPKGEIFFPSVVSYCNQADLVFGSDQLNPGLNRDPILQPYTFDYVYDDHSYNYTFSSVRSNGSIGSQVYTHTLPDGSFSSDPVPLYQLVLNAIDGYSYTQVSVYYTFTGNHTDFDWLDVLNPSKDPNRVYWDFESYAVSPPLSDYDKDILVYLMDFGKTALDNANSFGDVLNTSVLGYSFSNLLMGSGFTIFAGLLVSKWIIGIVT